MEPVILLDAVPVPGFDHRVTIQEQIDREDVSGAGNSGAGAHGGWKPALVTVRCLVRRDRPQDIGTLRLMFHDRDTGADTPRLMEITEDTCWAMGIRRVRFTERLQVEPLEGRDLWTVDFTLVEAESIPARTSERAAPGTAATPAAPDATQTTAGAAAGQWKPDGWLDTLLQNTNAWAGKYLFGAK